MNIMKKPTPPEGYRNLLPDQDITGVKDLIWIHDNNGRGRWVRAFQQTKTGISIASDTGNIYKDPVNVEDYYFFRCRERGEVK